MKEERPLVFLRGKRRKIFPGADGPKAKAAGCRVRKAAKTVYRFPQIFALRAYSTLGSVQVSESNHCKSRLTLNRLDYAAGCYLETETLPCWIGRTPALGPGRLFSESKNGTSKRIRTFSIRTDSSTDFVQTSQHFLAGIVNAVFSPGLTPPCQETLLLQSKSL